MKKFLLAAFVLTFALSASTSLFANVSQKDMLDSYLCEPQEESIFYYECLQDLKLTLSEDMNKLYLQDLTEDCNSEVDYGPRRSTLTYSDLISDSGCWVNITVSTRIRDNKETGVITAKTGGECSGETFKYSCEKI